MKSLIRISALLLWTTLAASLGRLNGQSNWPREIPLSGGGSITLYQPHPESLSGNKVSARSAVSVKTTANAEPVFGAVWADATTEIDRDNRMMSIETVNIKQVKFPDEENAANIEKLKQLLEAEIPKWNLSISLDQLMATLENNGANAATGLNNTPPKIIYSNKPATLVLIDGEPKVQKDKQTGMERVANTPFPIIKEAGKYYLFTGKYWHVSQNIISGWTHTTSLPANIKKVDVELQKQAKEQAEKNGIENTDEKPTAIIVSTEPAELIQTDGIADYSSLAGTSLLYVSNSPNDIFKDINSQKTYALIAGRWYSAPTMNGPWAFTEADKLPADFARIQEGGDKDNVLASVAGTNAANEAVLDAMIPQTATVDRKTAKLQTPVEYDGTPQFERIQGTNLELAVNTGSTVMRQNGLYYIVENGIWFEGTTATGPWRVSAMRPTDVENIPANSPAYNTRYVEIYDVRPDVVVVGYTPGYLNSYIYGPTVVYGTGWYYRPWWGSYYYPRPCTWGFGMNYNPWTGWSFNWGFAWSMGPFSMGISSGGWGFGFGYGGGGWFGPPVYRPPYRPPYWNGGYYRPGGGNWNNGGRPPGYNRPRPGGGINIGGDVNINIGGNQNIYNKMKDKSIQTRDINRRPGGGNFTNTDKGNINPSKPGARPTTPGPSAKPGTKPGTSPGTSPGGSTKLPGRPEPRPIKPETGRDIIADKNGNLYKRDENGNWNQRENKSWKPAPGNQPNLDKVQQQRDRGNIRDRSYDFNRPAMPTQRPATPAKRPSAPAARPASTPTKMPARKS
jgi:hypothetical protein